MEHLDFILEYSLTYLRNPTCNQYGDTLLYYHGGNLYEYC